MMPGGEGMKSFEREVTFEVLTLGKTIKINAVDVQTGVQVSLMAADGIRVSSLYQIVYEKLLSRLGKIEKNFNL